MQIEIWSDLICPWCYIGKRRFEAALTRLSTKPDIEVVWRSFELDPGAPTHLTESLEQMLARKYGVSAQQAAAMNAQVTQIAATDGLRYDLAQARPGNTFAAHRLIHFAKTRGLAEALTERLMRGYFSERMAIGEHEALALAAAQIGIDIDAARAVLGSDQFAAEVRADEQRAMRIGVRGVPFFLFDGKQAISGAQAVDVFVRALSQP